MPHYPLITGQQPVTTAPTALPSVIPQNPLNTVLSGGGIPRGEGWKITLTCLKGGTASLFYGNNSSVATNNGKELAPGNQDQIVLDDLAEIFVVAAGNGTSTASWSMQPAM